MNNGNSSQSASCFSSSRDSFVDSDWAKQSQEQRPTSQSAEVTVSRLRLATRDQLPTGSSPASGKRDDIRRRWIGRKQSANSGLSLEWAWMREASYSNFSMDQAHGHLGQYGAQHCTCGCGCCCCQVEWWCWPALRAPSGRPQLAGRCQRVKLCKRVHVRALDSNCLHPWP